MKFFHAPCLLLSCLGINQFHINSLCSQVSRCVILHDMDILLLICFCLVLTRESSGHFESHVDRHHLPRSLVTANGPTDWNEALDIISMGSPEQVVYSLFVSSVVPFSKLCMHNNLGQEYTDACPLHKLNQYSLTLASMNVA